MQTNRIPLSLIWVAAISLAVTLSSIQWLVGIVTQEPIQWLFQARTLLLFFAIWAILAPFIFALADRFPLGGKNALIRTCGHLVLSIVLSLAVIMLYSRIIISEGQSWSSAMSVMTAEYLDAVILFYWSLLLIKTSLIITRKMQSELDKKRALERDLSAARLQVLHAQLQPHFLFNTLQTISGMVQVDKKELAIETISELGDWLRVSLDANEQPFHSLDNELSAAINYLNLIQERFGHRVSVDIECPDDLKDQGVMRLVLQPLLENVVTHGVEPSVNPTSVQLQASLQNGQLVLRVCNQTQDPSKSRGQGHGLGLSNLRRRLENCYRGHANLATSETEGGFQAVVSLPLSSSGTL